MIAASATMVAALLGAEGPCDAAPPAPRIPLASEFTCPEGASLAQSPKGGVECIGRDGKATGDTFALEGKTGLMVHPLGLSVAWADGVVSWFHLRPNGHRVVYEGGKVVRVERFEGDELKCARHFEQGRLSRRYDDGKWTWLDQKGRAIKPEQPLERGEMASVLKEHQAEVQLCYESRLHEVKGEFHGNVAITVEITAGTVAKAEATEDTLHDPPVTECVRTHVLAWQFRPSTETVEVTFPFVFKERK